MGATQPAVDFSSWLCRFQFSCGRLAHYGAPFVLDSLIDCVFFCVPLARFCFRALNSQSVAAGVSDFMDFTSHWKPLLQNLFWTAVIAIHVPLGPDCSNFHTFSGEP